MYVGQPVCVCVRVYVCGGKHNLCGTCVKFNEATATHESSSISDAFDPGLLVFHRSVSSGSLEKKSSENRRKRPVDFGPPHIKNQLCVSICITL